MNLFNLFFSFCRSAARSATAAVVSGTSTALPVMAEVERGESPVCCFSASFSLKCADDQGQLTKALCAATHVSAYRRHDFVSTCKSLSCFPWTEGRRDDDEEQAGSECWSRKMSSRNWGLQWRDNCNIHGRCGSQEAVGDHASPRVYCAFDTNWEREGKGWWGSCLWLRCSIRGWACRIQDQRKSTISRRLKENLLVLDHATSLFTDFWPNPNSLTSLWFHRPP